MSKRLAQFSFCLVLPALVAMFCRPAWGQLYVQHSEYNDLVMQINVSGAAIFSSADPRKADAAELLEAIAKVTPLVRAEMDKPRMQAAIPFLSEQLNMYYRFRLALNEPSAVRENEAALAHGGPTAAMASINRAAADWLDAGRNPAAQMAAFDELRQTVKASARNLYYEFWGALLRFNPPGSQAVGSAMLAYLKPYSTDQQALPMMYMLYRDTTKQQINGKPLTIEGKLLSGAPFSTAAWEGKVVLVDRWPLNCPTTLAELSRMQSLRAKHRAHGLEVIGVANAPTLSELNVFLASHPEIDFPQIYKGPTRDCVITSAWLTADPLDVVMDTMVIDRKGILHCVDQDGDNLEAEIVKLLAEPAAEPVAMAPMPVGK